MRANRRVTRPWRRASTAPGAILGISLAALVGAGCFGGGAGKAGGAAQRPTIVLTMASQLSGGQPEQLLRFADEVARRSGGTIRIEFKANWRAGDVHQERDTIADVRIGKVDLAWVGARAWDWVGVHSFDPLVAPFLIDSHALEQRVFEAGIPERMLPAVSRAGVVPIGVLPGPLRTVLGVRDPLAKPSDFRARSIGVSGIVAARTVRALGARPHQLFAQPSLSGLDGIEEQLGAIVGNRHSSIAKYLSANLNLWPRPFVIVAAPRAFDSLTRAQQAALRDGAAAAIGDAMSASRQEDAQSARILCRQGLTFVDEQPAQMTALRRAVAPIYRWLERDANTGRLIAEIEALKRQTATDAPIVCAGRTTPQGQEVASPLDGIWEMRVGRGQLVGNPAYKLLSDTGSVHHPTEEDLRLDVGDYRLALRGGRLTFSLNGAVGRSRDSGTFTLEGDTVVFQITAGHDVGETWAYRWSLYRGMLTFLRPSDTYQPGPPNPMFAPWHRAGQ